MTSTIRKICVATDFTDGSDRTISYAAALARGFGASLYVIHVLEDERDYQDARRALAAIAATLAGDVDRVATEVRIGKPAAAINEAARRYGADLVVMSTHGRTGLSRAIAGSVTEEVIRASNCPILVVRDSGKVRVHRGATAEHDPSGQFAAVA
jgi:nucleotide-binding universal stress UspA family protein